MHLIVLAIVVAWAVAIFGWVLNIIDIFDTLGGEITALFVARLIGVPVAPLGSLLGLFS